MKKLLAVALIAVSALTATAATSAVQPQGLEVDEALVNAKIDARQNELMRALLAARRSGAVVTASR